MTEEKKTARAPKKAPAPAAVQTEPAVDTAEAGRREREGVVLSNKMQKTIIVQVTRLIEHPQFKKMVKSKVKYSVHDEKNEAKIGDKVRIVESRPLSKTKRWRLVQVLAK
jgi:small subunit ribosomal protein S17